jgi:hypothetical protein
MCLVSHQEVLELQVSVNHTHVVTVRNNLRMHNQRRLGASFTPVTACVHGASRAAENQDVMTPSEDSM